MFTGNHQNVQAHVEYMYPIRLFDTHTHTHARCSCCCFALLALVGIVVRLGAKRGTSRRDWERERGRESAKERQTRIYSCIAYLFALPPSSIRIYVFFLSVRLLLLLLRAGLQRQEKSKAPSRPTSVRCWWLLWTRSLHSGCLPKNNGSGAQIMCTKTDRKSATSTNCLW